MYSTSATSRTQTNSSGSRFYVNVRGHQLQPRQDSKPLPHRPFSLAPALELGESTDIADLGARRPSDASSVSTIPLTPLKTSFDIPPRPPHLHLPPPYRPSHHHSTLHPTSSSDVYRNHLYRTDTTTSSAYPATPRSIAHSTTSYSSKAPLVHEKRTLAAGISSSRMMNGQGGPNRRPSFLRRHWFVICVAILAIIGIAIAISVVFINRNGRTRNQSVYVPGSLVSGISSIVSETFAPPTAVATSTAEA